MEEGGGITPCQRIWYNPLPHCPRPQQPTGAVIITYPHKPTTRGRSSLNVFLFRLSWNSHGHNPHSSNNRIDMRGYVGYHNPQVIFHPTFIIPLLYPLDKTMRSLNNLLLAGDNNNLQVGVHPGIGVHPGPHIT